ncbi:hypothetical protein IFR05_014709 [Cadophora sp. M221]|nr:hypothetical protein IFR05_014709 [Cadophora sp. M221]
MSLSLPTTWILPLAATFSLFYTAHAQSNCTVSSLNLSLLLHKLHKLITYTQNLNGLNSAFPNGAYNASGSATVPGFRINSSYPESTWTWTRYVNQNIDLESNTSTVEETLGLVTDPVQNLSSRSQTPFAACVFVFNEFNKYKNDGSKENGTCNTMLTSECKEHLLATSRSNAYSLSGSSFSNGVVSCPSLLGALVATASDSPCRGQWTGVVSSPFLSQNSTDASPPPPGSRVCPVENLGNSTARDRAFLSWGDWEGFATDNYTAYDRAVRNVLPVLTVAWLKNTTYLDGWSDSRLFCLNAVQTTPESRSEGKIMSWFDTFLKLADRSKHENRRVLGSCEDREEWIFDTWL